jgi:hypothetical protein
MALIQYQILNEEDEFGINTIIIYMYIYYVLTRTKQSVCLVIVVTVHQLTT